MVVRRASRRVLWCLALASFAPGVVVAGSPAGGAADATCHGQPATLVGEPGSDVAGTDGPDVVVSNGATNIYTYAGNDVVCVTGGSERHDVTVDASVGEDLVDASESLAQKVSAHLGAGDDTFTGGPGRDNVWASDPWESPTGQGSDTVTTGGGSDLVVTGGTPTNPDHDQIDLGSGRDDVWLQGGVDPLLPIDGGPGSDQMELSRSALRHALVIDNSIGRATDAGVPVMVWAGMERFRLTPWGSWEPPSFIGGVGSERVWTAVPLAAVDLGDGDDRLNIDRRLVDDASYVGGDGDDDFTLHAGAGDQARRVALDLPGQQVLFRLTDDTVRAEIRDFELHRFSARRLDVRGTVGADRVHWSGCHGTVAGAGGDDVLKVISVPDAGCGVHGEDADLVTRGGPGDDVLVGNYFPDILIGGRGDDHAAGGRNADRCVAETTRGCEP